MLRQKVTEDMIVALKAKDTKRLNVVRTLLSQIKNVEIDKKAELNDEEVVSVIRKQVKALNDSVAMFEKGGRMDLAAENKAEIELLSGYLPAEMADGELEAKVKAVMEAHKEVSNPGQLTGMVVRELKGVAESSRVAAMVKKLVGNN
jgi:uncharacterized protein YqeY